MSSSLEKVIKAHTIRLHNTYQDFFDLDETRDLSSYFFEKIFNLDQKELRDKQFKRTYKRFRGLLKDYTKEKIERLLYLNELTDKLDNQIAVLFSEKFPDAEVLEDQMLPELYLEADQLTARIEQVELIIWNLRSFFKMTKLPMAEVFLGPIKMAAKLVGAGLAYAIFEDGFLASKQVSEEKFELFINSVAEREQQFLEKIFNCQVDLKMLQLI